MKTKKGIPVCNFYPQVLAIVIKHIGDESEHFVKLRLVFKSGLLSDEFIEPISELDSIKWVTKSLHCRLNSEMSLAKIQRYLADKIQAGLPNAKVEELYFVDRLGTHIIDELPFFNAGSQAIWPSGVKEKPNVELAPTPYKLITDPKITEADAVAEMFELMSLSPDPMRVILSHKLLYIMRCAYKKAWKAPCVSVKLYGYTGDKKTSAASLITQMYNLDEGVAPPIRLNSSIPAAEELLFIKQDCVVVLDDLFPAEYREDIKKQEKTFFEITRIIADGVSRGIKNNPNSGKTPTCGVLFTGEYLIGRGSDAARILPIEMSPPPDGEKLRKFQENPCIISTFYHHFISWYVTNYYKILGFLRQWRKHYDTVKIAEHDRLNETHFFLNTGYWLFLKYCCDRGFISEKDFVILSKSFQSLLTALIQEQQMRVNQGQQAVRHDTDTHSKVDYFMAIKVYYKNDGFTLSKTSQNFDESIHDGLIHSDCLCLFSKNIDSIIRKLGLSGIRRSIINSLESQGALITHDGRNAKQISGTGGKRFLFIPLSKLQ